MRKSVPPIFISEMMVFGQAHSHRESNPPNNAWRTDRHKLLNFISPSLQPRRRAHIKRSAEMDYYLRPWDECRGDEHADWGLSLWYFEVDGAGNVVRQVEAYECGKVLKYDRSNPNDQYGGLAEQPLDLVEFQPYAISAEEFHDRWNMQPGFIIECVHEDGSVSWWRPPTHEEFREAEQAGASDGDKPPC